MIITWDGQYTVRLQSKDLSILLDPFTAAVGLKPSRVKADVIALTNPSNDEMSNTTSTQGDPILLDTPGEFSLSRSTLHGFGWHDDNGNEHVIQRWQIEGMVILNVGALGRQLTEDELSIIDDLDIDILLVPVGGGQSFDATGALKLITKVEPRLLIPVHFSLPNLKEKLQPLATFSQEMGISAVEPIDKLNIKANQLSADGMQTVVLKPE
ncbi:MBL fold metallo-hydrolase [Patescibacteria group bacterium]|nr:MBL fold metallo-hydrolase [Patescibacteria group bacterium]